MPILFISLSVVLLAVWAIWLFYMSYQIMSSGMAIIPVEWFGQIGDSFGFLTSLFTLLAFGLISYSLHIQNKQIRQQSEHFEKTMEHLKQEDRWTRLKTKIEVLPNLCEQKEYEVQVMLEEINQRSMSAGNGFSMSSQKLDKLHADISGEISKNIASIKLFESSKSVSENELNEWLQHLEESQSTDKGREEWEIKQNVINAMGGKNSSEIIEGYKKDLLRKQSDIDQRRNAIDKLQTIISLIDEIRRYRSDLAEAYSSVQG